MIRIPIPLTLPLSPKGRGMERREQLKLEFEICLGFGARNLGF